ncbi:hypothetical protein V8C37DRAFT_401765 [Trichoderma ceciliae]
MGSLLAFERPTRNGVFTTMHEAIKVNFIATGDLGQLESVIKFLEEQQFLLASLSKALDWLSHNTLSRHQKYRRMYAMVQFYHDHKKSKKDTAETIADDWQLQHRLLAHGP